MVRVRRELELLNDSTILALSWISSRAFSHHSSLKIPKKYECSQSILVSNDIKVVISTCQLGFSESNSAVDSTQWSEVKLDTLCEGYKKPSNTKRLFRRRKRSYYRVVYEGIS